MNYMPKEFGFTMMRPGEMENIWSRELNIVFILKGIRVSKALFLDSEWQIAQKNLCALHCTRHSNEPLRAKIMSAKAATILESHFHCAKVVCPSFFCAICQVTFYARAFDTRILKVMAGFIWREPIRIIQ